MHANSEFSRESNSTEPLLLDVAISIKILCTGLNVNRPLVNSVYQNYFSYFSTKTYVVGTQKNCLNETVLLRNQNIC